MDKATPGLKKHAENKVAIKYIKVQTRYINCKTSVKAKSR